MAYRQRNSQKSREDILNASEAEFAAKGIYGTRVDEIAKRADINKRMIYEYFGKKEDLYKVVLERSYSRLGFAEIDLLSKDIDPVDAIRKIIRLYFEFLYNNPNYVNLIMWENLNKGRFINEIDFTSIKHPAFEMLKKVLKNGRAINKFRQNEDDDQLIISLLTFTFSYFSNRYTLSRLLDIKLDTKENIDRRIKHVTEMFLSYIKG